MDSIVSHFERMGARAKRRGNVSGAFSIDVRRDRDGEYFELLIGLGVEVLVVDVRRRERHLLLHTHNTRARDGAKSKFLCGHDERHWFIAAVPEVQGVRDVPTAMDALKPQEVWDAIAEHGVNRRVVNHRNTGAFVRQGEWFFIPFPRLNTRGLTVLHHEPITRGRGKPHWCQYLARQGGENVMVSPLTPQGVTKAEFERMDRKIRDQFVWRRMQRDATVFARGYVRHPDHATIRLRDWHRVVMNTESRASAMRHLAFLD